MTAPRRQHRARCREREARAAAGMPPGHPELITRRPSRAEWAHFAAWCAELWPHDEYAAIAARAWRRLSRRPPDQL